jgi:hypothetical protein
MSPLVISIIRFTRRIAVVLPQPDGPTRTQISPEGTTRLRSVIAGSAASPKTLRTSRNSRVAACGCDDGPSERAVVVVTRTDESQANRKLGNLPRGAGAIAPPSVDHSRYFR